MLLEQVNGIHLFLKVLSTNSKKDHLEIVFNRLANNLVKFLKNSWCYFEGDF